MTEQELKKLRRNDLLERIIAQEREINELRTELEAANEKLRSREITIEKAGSIAEASMELNEIFKAAQSAADQYVENMNTRAERVEAECRKKEAECTETVEKTMAELRAKCDSMEIESRSRCEKLESETEQQCRQMKREAKEASKRYWTNLSGKLEKLYEDHKGLKELMNIEIPSYDAEK